MAGGTVGGADVDAVRRRVRRQMRSYAAASLATVVPPALGLYEDASGLFGVSWGLGALVVFTALFSVKQARKGAETGRVAAIRDEGLATGEYTLTQYKVFLPDDRPKSSPEREESPLTLRTTNLGLQHWDNDVLRWSHPWAASASSSRTSCCSCTTKDNSSPGSGCSRRSARSTRSSSPPTGSSGTGPTVEPRRRTADRLMGANLASSTRRATVPTPSGWWSSPARRTSPPPATSCPRTQARGRAHCPVEQCGPASTEQPEKAFRTVGVLTYPFQTGRSGGARGLHTIARAGCCFHARPWPRATGRRSPVPRGTQSAGDKGEPPGGALRGRHPTLGYRR